MALFMKSANVGRKGVTILKKTTVLFWGIAAVVALLNITAWNSAAFCDWYIAHIFPLWVNTYGRLTGLFPFSVGEWLIVAGLVLLIAAVLLLLPWGVVEILGAVRVLQGKCIGQSTQSADGDDAAVEERPVGRSRLGNFRRLWDFPRIGDFRRFARRYYRFFAWTLLAVCLVMTMNCFILYHASTFSQRFFKIEGEVGEVGTESAEYTLEELISVYNMVAERCLALSEEIERDENGQALYTGSVGRNGEKLDMADKARQLMRELGETYDQLDGYYPRPKALLSSDFMCQQYMCGYYFPFSMEANYNDVMYILNIPATMCHELAHLRGFIYEDEANFIAYLACVESDDIFFQYAGYLSVLTYLYNDLYRANQANPEAFAQTAEIVQPVVVTAQVWEDSVFVTDEEWERINSKALIDTEIVDQASDVFIDTNLKVNGISDGSVSYSRVVRLMLQYYRLQQNKL